jgi:hypothetical protein
MHTAKSLKDKKNHHIVFSYNEKKSYFFIHETQKKKLKKYVLACILAIIISLLEL